MNIKKNYIYELRTPDNYVYIGMTTREPEERWEEHFDACYKENKDIKVYNKLREFDWDDISKKVVSEHLAKKDILEIECEAIHKALSEHGDKLLNTIMPNEARYVLRKLKYRSSNAVRAILSDFMNARGKTYAKVRLDVEGLNKAQRELVRSYKLKAVKLSETQYRIKLNVDCILEFNIDKIHSKQETRLGNIKKIKATGSITKKRKGVKNIESIMIK